MTEYFWPALYTIFIWWFSTGAILYLNTMPRHTYKWSMTGATIIFVVSLYGISVTSTDTSITGAYLAFTFGLLAWGWKQISYYMDYITGPRKTPSPEGTSRVKHFFHGVETALYHELAIIATVGLMVVLTWEQPNKIGLWTYIVLWWMHLSAKLNMFFGVRNMNEEFLPEHFAYLKSFFTKKSMNFFFPISVTISTVVTAWLIQKAVAPEATQFEMIGYTFLAVIMALAVLEHWFLVLPLPAAKLWHWGLASRDKTPPIQDKIEKTNTTSMDDLTPDKHRTVTQHKALETAVSRPLQTRMATNYR